jgi:hypothetical protein
MSEKRTADDPSTGATASVTNLEYGLEVVKHQVANMVHTILRQHPAISSNQQSDPELPIIIDCSFSQD